MTANPTRDYRVPALAAVAPATLLVCVFVIAPTATIAVTAADPGSLADLVTDPALRRVLWFSLWQAAASTLLTLAAGIPLAWATSTRTWRGRRIVTGLITAPFVMPTVAMALAVRSVLPDSADTGTSAILLAHVLFNLAVVVRTVGPRWAMIDPGLGDAARVLGAGPVQVARTTLWPQLRGAVVNAGAVVFVFCFTSFGVVSVLGGARERTVEVEIFRRAVQLGDTGAAVALSVAQLVVVAAVLAAAPRRHGPEARSVGEPPRLADAHLRVRIAVPAVAGAGAALVLAPITAVVLDSLRDARGWTTVGWTSLADGSLAAIGVDVGAAARTSVVFALVAAAIAAPAAAALAIGGAHLGRAGRAAGATSLAPLLVSSITLAFGIVITFDASPLEWRDDPWLLPVVHAMIALPLVHRIVAPAAASVSPGQRDAARVLGASPLRAMVDVDLAQTRRAALGGAGLAAAVSLGEFGASSMLARSGNETVPVVLGRLAGRAGEIPQQASQALAAAMAIAVTAVMARA